MKLLLFRPAQDPARLFSAVFFLLLFIGFFHGFFGAFHGFMPEGYRFFSGTVLMHGDQIGLHVLILFIKNKEAVQRRGVAVLKKRPRLLLVKGRLSDPVLKGKVSAFHQLPARLLLCRSVNKIVGDLSFLLQFSIETEVRFIFPVLSQQGMYIVLHINFVTGIRFSCLYHIFRNLHAFTAFFSFNIAEEARGFYQNARPFLFFPRNGPGAEKCSDALDKGPGAENLRAGPLGVSCYTKRKIVVLRYSLSGPKTAEGKSGSFAVSG